MSLEKIVAKIISDAEAEAEKVIQESRDKAANIRMAAEKEGAERAAAYLQEAEREAALEASRTVSQARLERKLKILRQKRELLDDILRSAFEADSLRQKELKRKIIVKDGEREELVAREQLIEELRSRLENDILEALKI
jgi:vacuolar-type H+-ATPase subunit E/Vma4